MTIQTHERLGASPLAYRDLLDASELAEVMAGELLDFSASWVVRLYEKHLAATGIQPNFTPQDALVAQLRVLKAMAEVIEQLQDTVLEDGKSAGLSNAGLAEPLRLSPERVRQRLAARTSRLAK